jgi:para-nitrobenzyl esterase
MMIGTNGDETTLLLGQSDPTLFTLDWDGLQQRLAAVLGPMAAPAIAASRTFDPQATPSDVAFRLTTHPQWRMPALAMADWKAAQPAPVHMYQLDWRTPVDGGKWKAPHALDLAFVFDNIAVSRSMVGDDPDAQRLADEMSAAWAGFARTGDPGWPRYDATRRTTRIFDRRSVTIDDPSRPFRTALGM